MKIFFSNFLIKLGFLYLRITKWEIVITKLKTTITKWKIRIKKYQLRNIPTTNNIPHNRLLEKDYYHLIFPHNKDLSPHNNLHNTNPILYGILWVLIAPQNRYFWDCNWLLDPYNTSWQPKKTEREFLGFRFKRTL